MVRPWLDLGPTLKTLNPSLLQFFKRFGSETLEILFYTGIDVYFKG